MACRQRGGFWQSRDGDVWALKDFESVGLDDADTIAQIASADAGWVAVGESDADSVWFSADGEQWGPADTRAPLLYRRRIPRCPRIHRPRTRRLGWRLESGQRRMMDSSGRSMRLHLICRSHRLIMSPRSVDSACSGVHRPTVCRDGIWIDRRVILVRDSRTG